MRQSSQLQKDLLWWTKSKFIRELDLDKPQPSGCGFFVIFTFFERTSDESWLN
jgi:hypothetical protein